MTATDLTSTATTRRVSGKPAHTERLSRVAACCEPPQCQPDNNALTSLTYFIPIVFVLRVSSVLGLHTGYDKYGESAMQRGTAASADLSVGILAGHTVHNKG